MDQQQTAVVQALMATAQQAAAIGSGPGVAAETKKAADAVLAAALQQALDALKGK